MKTLEQRLQSRISLRRNLITVVEAVRVEIKAQAKNTGLPYYYDQARLVRAELKELAIDQKLDKELYATMLDHRDMLRALDNMWRDCE